MKEKRLKIAIGALLLLATVFHILLSFKVWEKANIVTEFLFCILFFLKFIQCKKDDKKEAYGFLFLAILFLIVFFVLIFV